MGGSERTYVEQAFDSNFIAPLGPQLARFEAITAAYLSEGLGHELHCVGLSSGSAALHLALRMQGVGPGDEVWISSMTFAGGIFPVVYQGATPVFFDLSADSWTMDVDLLAEALAKANAENRLPRAIVPTDLYGQSVDIAGLEALAARYGVALIIDSAESLGAADVGGRRAGSGGDAAILSYNGNKIITTSGGGMLVTRHGALAEKARFLSTQARDPAPHYEHSELGYNYRLSNISAAIGLGQMEVLDTRVDQRRAVFDRYRAAFGAHPGVHFMPEPKGARSSHWLSALRFDPAACGTTREHLREALLAEGIEARPLWKPMHMQPLFEGTKYIGRGLDETLFAEGLCLPSGSDMTEAEQSEVIEIIGAHLS
jgi:pyridoxal phosphate-dependent aminotransferase EpsN